jgi:glycosyltransferase involved in cell wall biosynthesis
MKKLLLLIRSLDIGGTEVQLVGLAGGLIRSGADVKVVTFYSGGLLEAELETLGVQTISLEKKGRWDLVSFLFRFTRLLYSYRPMVIYSFLTGPNLCAIIGKLFLPSIKVVWGVRSTVADSALRENDRLVGLMFHASKILCQVPARIIVNSNRALEYHIILGFPKRKLVFIPNGIDTEYYQYNKHDAQLTRDRLHIKTNSFVIGIVARLDPIKGHRSFLMAAHLFIQEFPETIFVIVGSGAPQFVEKLHQFEKTLGIEKNTRWVKEGRNLRGLYSSLDIFTLPSDSESFPNSLAEAMACGISCVVSDVGDCRSIAGDLGKYVAPGDIEQLVTAWKSFYIDRKRGCLKKPNTLAADRITENYSIEKLTLRTIAALELED